MTADLPPCPKCHRAPDLKRTFVALICCWHRIHCLHCYLGVGAETLDEASEQWRKLCAGWNR